MTGLWGSDKTATHASGACHSNLALCSHGVAQDAEWMRVENSSTCSVK